MVHKKLLLGDSRTNPKMISIEKVDIADIIALRICLGFILIKILKVYITRN